MRRILAVLIDAIAVAILGYLGFRLALALAPCDEISECAIVTPMVVVLALLFIVSYFLAGRVAFGHTPGERLANL